MSGVHTALRCEGVELPYPCWLDHTWIQHGTRTEHLVPGPFLGRHSPRGARNGEGWQVQPPHWVPNPALWEQGFGSSRQDGKLLGGKLMSKIDWHRRSFILNLWLGAPWRKAGFLPLYLAWHIVHIDTQRLFCCMNEYIHLQFLLRKKKLVQINN